MVSLALRASGGLLFKTLRQSSGLGQLRMASMLVDDAKYGWLKELGLQAENDGVFTGLWGGSGPVSLRIKS